MGEVVSAIDYYGVFLISDINTDNCSFQADMGNFGNLVFFHYFWSLRIYLDGAGRCRWSTNKGESLLYLKYNESRLNILDVEKEMFALKEPFRLGGKKEFLTMEGIIKSYFFHSLVCCWIDVCQNNGNLLVSDGEKFEIQIFDKRESKIVKTFDGIHKGKFPRYFYLLVSILCVVRLANELIHLKIYVRDRFLCEMESERRHDRERLR